MTEQLQKVHASYIRKVVAARYWLLARCTTNKNYGAVLACMEFALAHHNGTRNGGGPEFMHQIEIFHHLRTMEVYFGEQAPLIFALAFLHDVIEDGQKQSDGSKKYVTLEDIRLLLIQACAEDHFVQSCVNLLETLSKEICGQVNPQYSLDLIFGNRLTAVVKLADRCNNISSMMGVFKKHRAERYVTETREKFLPNAKLARRTFPEYECVFENMKLFLQAQLTLIDYMMPTYNVGVAPQEVQEVLEPPPVKVTAILAAGPGGEVGYDDGALFVHCKEDMKFFKETTMGHALIMGRKTFDSLPMTKQGCAPLTGRYIFVLTSDVSLSGVHGAGFEYVYSGAKAPLREMINYVKTIIQCSHQRLGIANDRLFLCGGASLYNEAFADDDVLDEILFSSYCALGETCKHIETVKQRIEHDMHPAFVHIDFNNSKDLWDFLSAKPRSKWKVGDINGGQVLAKYPYNNAPEFAMYLSNIHFIKETN